MIESITINNAVEMEDLNELAEKVQKPEEAADIIKQYEDILQTKRKGIISVAYYQASFSSASRRRKSLYRWSAS